MMYTMLQRDRAIRGLELEITRRYKNYGAAGFADAEERSELSRKIAEESGGRNLLEWLKDSSTTPIYMPSIYVRFGAQPSPIAAAKVGAVHSAFVCNNVNVKDLCIGKYQGYLHTASDGKKYLLSLRGMDPSVSQTLSTFSAAARNANAGDAGAQHHICTNAEYAFLALLCKAQGYQPRGNNYYGKDVAEQTETGDVAYSYLESSNNTRYIGRVLTGSGPLPWSHDGSPYGVWDLNGNVWEFTDGLQLSDGKILIIKDNDAASSNASINAVYKSVLPDGTLGATDAATALKFVAAAADYGILLGGSGAQFKTAGQTYGTASAAAPALLKELCIIPHDAGDYGSDGLWYNLSGARCALRGGRWTDGSNAGVFALYLLYALASTGDTVGARPAFLRS